MNINIRQILINIQLELNGGVEAANRGVKTTSVSRALKPSADKTLGATNNAVRSVESATASTSIGSTHRPMETAIASRTSFSSSSSGVTFPNTSFWNAADFNSAASAALQEPGDATESATDDAENSRKRRRVYEEEDDDDDNKIVISHYRNVHASTSTRHGASHSSSSSSSSYSSSHSSSSQNSPQQSVSSSTFLPFSAIRHSSPANAMNVGNSTETAAEISRGVPTLDTELQRTHGNNTTQSQAEQSSDASPLHAHSFNLPVRKYEHFNDNMDDEEALDKAIKLSGDYMYGASYRHERSSSPIQTHSSGDTSSQPLSFSNLKSSATADATATAAKRHDLNDNEITIIRNCLDVILELYGVLEDHTSDLESILLMSNKLQPMHTILADEGFDFDLLEKINIMCASCSSGGLLASTFYTIPAMHGIANAIICYIKDVLFESGEIPAGTVANSIYGKVVTLGQQIGGDWSRPKEPLSTVKGTIVGAIAAVSNNRSSAPANSCSGAVGSDFTVTAEPIGRGHIGEHSPLGDGESHDVSNSTVAQPSAQRAFIDAFNDGLSEDEAVSRAIDLSTTADVN